jgi:hypothetical protein
VHHLSEIQEEIRRRWRMGSDKRDDSACVGELHRDGIDNYMADIHHGKD